jgi:hypothetical protein
LIIALDETKKERRREARASMSTRLDKPGAGKLYSGGLR